MIVAWVAPFIRAGIICASATRELRRSKESHAGIKSESESLAAPPLLFRHNLRSSTNIQQQSPAKYFFYNVQCGRYLSMASKAVLFKARVNKTNKSTMATIPETLEGCGSCHILRLGGQSNKSVAKTREIERSL